MATAAPSSIEDSEIPKAIVTRIVRKKIPDNFMISKDTREVFVKASTVFINYLTATASDISQSKNLKTISAESVLSALEELEFDSLLGDVRGALEHYRREMKEKKSSGKSNSKTVAGANGGKKSGRKASTSGANGENGSGSNDMETDGNAGETDGNHAEEDDETSDAEDADAAQEDTDADDDEVPDEDEGDEDGNAMEEDGEESREGAAEDDDE